MVSSGHSGGPSPLMISWLYCPVPNLSPFCRVKVNRNLRIIFYRIRIWMPIDKILKVHCPTVGGNFFLWFSAQLGFCTYLPQHYHPQLPLPSGDTWQCLETISVVTAGNWGGDTNGIYLRMLQWTGQFPEQRFVWPPISIVQRLINPVFS